MQQLYLIESTVTNDIYIDNENRCHAFLRQEKAVSFCEEHENTRVSDMKYIEMNDLDQMCYAAGADSIIFQAGEETEEHIIVEKNLPLLPYNHTLNRAIAKIKHTKSTKNLAELSLSHYIVAARVYNGDETKIVYAVAEHKILQDLGKLYIVFSNLDEFSIWQMNCPDWEPLRVDYNGLLRITGKNGIMINPSGNRLILTGEMLTQAK